jgi:putative ABC transport system permease protein
MFSVAIITGLIALTAGIKERMGEELRSYGANIIITATDGYMEASIAEFISGLKEVLDVTPQLVESVFVRDEPIDAIGISEKGIEGLRWKLTGRWPEKDGEIVLGSNLKDALKIEIGEKIELSYDDNKKEFFITGFFEQGGAADNSILMGIGDLQSLTGLGDKFSIILVRGSIDKLEEIRKDIERVLSGVNVKTVRQVARAEESLLKKIQLLMIFVTIIVLFATSVSVASTMGANILEKREEIGLMKALGANRKDISIFFLIEAILIGISGGIGGFIFGVISAESVSKAAFMSFIDIPFYLPVLSILIGLIVATLSSYIPVRDAMTYNSAVILRGE